MLFVEDCHNHELSNFITGIGFSEDGLICTQRGFEEYLNENKDPRKIWGGKFVCKWWHDNTCFYRTDESGQDLIFYYNSGDYWAVSNSFWALSNHVNQKKFPLTLDKTFLAQSFVFNSRFEQPIGEDLAYKEIKLIPENKEIAVCRGVLTVIDKEPYQFSEINNGEVDIEESVAKFVSFFSSLAKGVSLHNKKLQCELTGGLDSRVLFAMLIFSDTISNLGIFSKKNKKDDFTVAGIMSDLFGVPFEAAVDFHNSHRKRLANSFRFNLYNYGNIGVSRTKLSLPGSRNLNQMIRFNGGGGEYGKSFYGDSVDRCYEPIKKSIITDAYKGKVWERFLGELRKFSGDDTYKLNNLYKKTRYRYFAGRGWLKKYQGVVISPFTTVLYEKIFGSKDIESFFGAKHSEIVRLNMVHKLLIKSLCPSLLGVVFEDERNNLSPEDIRNIPTLSVDKVSSPLRIYGDIVNDYSQTDSVIKAAGYEDIGEFASLEDYLYSEIKSTDLKSLCDIGVIDDSIVSKLACDLHEKNLSAKMLVSIFHSLKLLSISSDARD